MKKIIIIGTGAHASELVDYIDDYNKYCNSSSRIEVKGFIDYEYNIEKYHNKYKLEAPVLGDIDSFITTEDDFFIIGIANIPFREKIIKSAEEKNWQFTNFIHQSCIISKSSNIGIGNVLCPGCIIGANVQINNFNFLNCYATISHDCIVGNNNVLSSYSGIAGHVKINNNNFLSLHSAIIPKLSIGSNNIIQAGMIVDKSINDNEIIFHRFKEKVIAIPKIENNN